MQRQSQFASASQSDLGSSLSESHPWQSDVGSRAFQNARLQKKNRKQADALLPAAVTAYREGRHAEAQAICRQILALLPDHFDALHLLGVSALDGGRLDLAEQALTQAVEVEPRHAEAQSNLGLALFNLKRFEEARKCQERAIALKPNFATALTGLGNTLMRLRLSDQAIAAHDRAIALKPDYADAYCNRGMALLLLNRNTEANQSFDRALSLNPRHMEAMFGKGLASINLRHFDEALAAFDAALAIRPDAAAVLAQRGRLHQQAGQFDQAKADFDAALARRSAAGGGAARQGPAERSHGQHRAGDGRLPQGAGAESPLRGRLDLARRMLCQAGRDRHRARSISIARSSSSPITRTRSPRRSSRSTSCPTPISPSIRPRGASGGSGSAPGSRDGRLRVAGSRSRAAAHRRLCLLRFPDPFGGAGLHAGAAPSRPPQFEVVCYSCSPLQDEMTEQCRAAADVWVDAWQMSDEELADRIEADQVDILVDLSGHSAGNRLTVFARKPAPIQVTAWGSGTGTGLPTIDYFFADPVTVPQAVRHLFAEQVYDLPAVITTDPLPGCAADAAADAAQWPRHLRRLQPDRQDFRPGAGAVVELDAGAAGLADRHQERCAR